MAKVLEAMEPASAARILTDFPDGDVKQIILTIKKRQAAKILAALQPDRAARIMR
jgi:flagellar motility protein MotE (MotC chaperone)